MYCILIELNKGVFQHSLQQVFDDSGLMLQATALGEENIDSCVMCKYWLLSEEICGIDPNYAH